MSKVFSCLVSLVLLSAACSGGDDDDTGGSGGQGQSGSGTAGLSVSGSSGSGGASAGSGGSAAGSGGSSAGKGGSGASGSSGKAGSGGSGGGAGGSQPSGGSGGVMIPRPTGTIGTAVECGDTAGDCAGTACCRALTAWSCVSDFDECACSLEGRCTAVGCDEPADCNGGRCCALVNPRSSPGYVATSCKAECESGEREVCVTDDDCQGSDTCQSGSDFDWCF